MNQCVETEQAPSLPENLDSDKLFEGLIEVWIGTEFEVHPVCASVTQNVAPYLRTSPIHKNQRKLGESKNGWIDFEWQVKPTPDFISRLRSWDKKLKVLKPEWVKIQI